MNRWDSPHETSKWQIQCSWVGPSFIQPEGFPESAGQPYPAAAPHKLCGLWMSTPAICPFPVLKHFCHSQGYRRCVVGIHLLLWVCPTVSQRIPLLQGALPAAHLWISSSSAYCHSTQLLCVSHRPGPHLSPSPQVSTGYPFSHWTRKTENIWHKLDFTFLVLNLYIFCS